VTRLRSRPQATGDLRCAWCHGALESDGAACLGCGTLLHPECAGSGCPTLGCAGEPAGAGTAWASAAWTAAGSAFDLVCGLVLPVVLLGIAAGWGLTLAAAVAAPAVLGGGLLLAWQTRWRHRPGRSGSAGTALLCVGLAVLFAGGFVGLDEPAGVGETLMAAGLAVPIALAYLRSGVHALAEPRPARLTGARGIPRG